VLPLLLRLLVLFRLPEYYYYYYYYSCYYELTHSLTHSLTRLASLRRTAS